ncbi:MAG: tripartite tricarboxylate transporter substrate binding protein [Betaproteobacteria bacterium]|nr:tripartite tricarboxylate transporter substrate binding protein [Betaproteobacteria bacterium]
MRRALPVTLLARALPVTLLASMLCVLSVLSAHAQSFPSKTVRIVLPYSAGSSTDVLARALAAGLSPLWGQPVVVENVTGAGSIVGAERVATAAPDGHTLLFTIDPTVVGNRFLYKKLPYDPDKSLIPVTMIAQSGMFVIVTPSVPANSFRELVEAARRAPGKISYGSSGMGSPQHLMFEAIAKREGVQFLHVIYRGVAPAIAATVSGEVQATGASAAAVGAMLKAGRVKALVIGGARRSKFLPDVPTLAESGYPYATLALWFGLFAPGGTDAQLVGRLYRDATSIAKRPEFVEKYIIPPDLTLVASNPRRCRDHRRDGEGRWHQAGVIAGVKTFFLTANREQNHVRMESANRQYFSRGVGTSRLRVL